MWPMLDGKRVLDLGCGNGLYTGELARRGAVAIGVDFHRESLRRGKQQQQAGRGRCYFVCAQADALPFREGAFDMAISVEVLTHIAPQPRSEIMRSVCRLLKERGRVYYSLHNRLRMSLGRWVRLRPAQEMYPTSNLDVWPMQPMAARAALAACAMHLVAPIRFMNYHSRFSYQYYNAHPLLGRLIVAMEEAICRLPLLRRLAITFLIVAEKDGSTTGRRVGSQ